MLSTLALLLPLVAGQVRVLSPASLLKVFSEGGPLAAPNGIIPASTATFGTPTYGESLVGRLLLINSTSCKFDYGDQLEKEYNVTSMREESHSLRDVFLIPRGECSFVRKVAVAEQAGAEAVIIMDAPDSPWDRRQVSQVILADDGNGQRISIPSVLVEKDDGRALASADFSSPPLVTMEWNLPQKDVVSADFWTSSGSVEATRFLANVAPAIARLKGLVDFRTHYFVLRMHSGVEEESTQKLCYNGDPSLCVSPPDAGSTATSQDVIQENLRQLCIAELYPSPLTAQNSDEVLGYSEKWWNYVEQMPSECPLRTVDREGAKAFGEKCSVSLMEKVGANPTDVLKCVSDQGLSLLQREQNNNAWAVNAIRVNGARFSGNVDPLLVVQALCSAFEQEPKECNETLRWLESNSKASTNNQTVIVPSSTASSWFHFGLLVCIVGVSLFAGIYFYQVYSNHGLRRALRHEVMLEVKSQLQDYYRVEEPVWSADTGGVAATRSSGSQARETEFTKLKFRV